VNGVDVMHDNDCWRESYIKRERERERSTSNRLTLNPSSIYKSIHPSIHATIHSYHLSITLQSLLNALGKASLPLTMFLQITT